MIFGYLIATKRNEFHVLKKKQTEKGGNLVCIFHLSQKNSQ